jgi:putative flippase GtrA
MGPVVSRKFLSFLAVGTGGFVVDAAILTLLLKAGWSVVPARAVSFLVAVSVTWLLNRSWTFDAARHRPPGKQFLGYLLTQTGGGLINVAAFLALFGAFRVLRDFPLIPLAAGSALGLAFNYVLARHVVFR